MAKRTNTYPALKNGGVDMVTVFDSMGDFADASQAARDHSSANNWNGGQSADTLARLCRTGDDKRVAGSDAYLKLFEDMTGFETKAFATVDAVAGGVPNVAAFLAGSPVSMRRRQRVTKESAPLNVVVDIVSSGGIDSAQLEKRGAAILALVRVLSAVRPVRLYVVASAKPAGARADGKEVQASAICFPIDTAPLDLTRAAHALCSTGVARLLSYDMVCAQTDGGGSTAENRFIAWPYGDHDFSRAKGVEFWQRALGMDEMLFVAGAFLTDENIRNPAQWVRDMVAKYGTPAE